MGRLAHDTLQGVPDGRPLPFPNDLNGLSDGGHEVQELSAQSRAQRRAKPHAVKQANRKIGEAMIAWQALPDHPTPVKARARAPGSAGLTALTDLACPAFDGHALMAQRERYGAPRRK